MRVERLYELSMIAFGNRCKYARGDGRFECFTDSPVS